MISNRVLFAYIKAKALYKAQKYVGCFETLQNQFVESPKYTALLLKYGKYVIKTMRRQVKQQNV